jgi:ubiquinone/menaquinone biosynthesis C-methylase UbiE
MMPLRRDTLCSWMETALARANDRDAAVAPRQAAGGDGHALSRQRNRAKKGKSMGIQDYDRMARAYGRHRAPHPDVIDVLIEHGQLSSRSHVLEIGCGTGNYLIEIAGRIGTACAGVDPSREMLSVAVANAALLADHRARSSDVSFVRGAAELLPFPDHAFDLAYSVDVVHHIEDRNAAWSEMWRVLRPGGMAVVVTESEDDLRRRTPHVTYFPDIVAVELARYPSIDAIIQELAATGFELREPVSVSRRIDVDSMAAFRDKAYSSLHLIGDDAFRAGLARMKDALRCGPLAGERRYTIVIARRPSSTRGWDGQCRTELLTGIEARRLARQGPVSGTVSHEARPPSTRSPGCG